MNQVEDTKPITPEMESKASQKAVDKARVGRWDLNIAIFLFAILILVMLLTTYTKVGIEVVALVALFGLAMVWLVGWRRQKRLYKRFYAEELENLKQASKQTFKETVKETFEETIEAQVRKALRERWK